LPHGGNDSLVYELGLRGITLARVVGVPQGYKLNSAIRTLERRLAEGAVTVAAQDLMSWAVSNAKIEPRGNAVLITKQASGSGKIDPLMAALNAVCLMSLNPEVPLHTRLQHAILARGGFA
jgi:phage terminase large subunit-like protein